MGIISNRMITIPKGLQDLQGLLLCDTFPQTSYLIVTMKINLFKQHNSRTAADEIDWKEVYDRLLSQVFHYFCYKTGDADLAEELTAVTFEKAWAGRANYRNDLGKFTFWLYGIARNVAVDHFRSYPAEAALDDLAETASPNSVEEQVQRSLAFTRLMQFIRLLPTREQEIISLKYGAEMTNREIARAAGLSESNVGTILFRTVAHLREVMEEEK
jgi:RNA polymerase sigma-70 factor, ECF subfamily